MGTVEEVPGEKRSKKMVGVVNAEKGRTMIRMQKERRKIQELSRVKKIIRADLDINEEMTGIICKHLDNEISYSQKLINEFETKALANASNMSDESGSKIFN